MRSKKQIIKKFVTLLFRPESVFMLVEAIIYALFFRLIIFVMPFRFWGRFLGEQITATNNVKYTCNANVVKKTTLAMRRSTKYLPFKSKCLVEALVAKTMLNNRKIASTLFLGVQAKGKPTLTAHAWLVCNNEIIAGKKGHEKFTVVARYA